MGYNMISQESFLTIFFIATLIILTSTIILVCDYIKLRLDENAKIKDDLTFLLIMHLVGSIYMLYFSGALSNY